eukprot:3101346-Prymnesium_polylepis.2
MCSGSGLDNTARMHWTSHCDGQLTSSSWRKSRRSKDEADATALSAYAASAMSKSSAACRVGGGSSSTPAVTPLSENDRIFLTATCRTSSLRSSLLESFKSRFTNQLRKVSSSRRGSPRSSTQLTGRRSTPRSPATTSVAGFLRTSL